jgi:hypothetical protein
MIGREKTLENVKRTKGKKNKGKEGIEKKDVPCLGCRL